MADTKKNIPVPQEDREKTNPPLLFWNYGITCTLSCSNE